MAGVAGDQHDLGRVGRPGRCDKQGQAEGEQAAEEPSHGFSLVNKGNRSPPARTGSVVGDPLWGEPEGGAQIRSLVPGRATGGKGSGPKARCSGMRFTFEL